LPLSKITLKNTSKIDLGEEILGNNSFKNDLERLIMEE
jgi:hypothetical protein